MQDAALIELKKNPYVSTKQNIKIFKSSKYSIEHKTLSMLSLQLVQWYFSPNMYWAL